MQTILLIEPDKEFARTLAQSVKQLVAVTISTVPTIREGCLVLAQRRQDVIFLPATRETEPLLRALRALQADVPVVLTLPTRETAVSPTLIQQVQAILPHNEATKKLPTVLASLLAAAPEQALSGPASPAILATQPIDQTTLNQTLTHLQLGRLIQTVIVATENDAIASHGQHVGMEIGRFLRQALHERDERHDARLQFMTLPPRKTQVMLYSVRLSASYLLILIATAEASLSELRLKAEEITAVVQSSLTGRPLTPHAQTRTAYNIAWKPREPLPNEYHVPLRRTLERVAHDHACILTAISVEPDLIHLNINCPSIRGSDWIAFLLKSESDEVLQHAFQHAESLWEAGYYASESAKPLSENELNLFLESHMSAERKRPL